MRGAVHHPSPGGAAPLLRPAAALACPQIASLQGSAAWLPAMAPHTAKLAANLSPGCRSTGPRWWAQGVGMHTQLRLSPDWVCRAAVSDSRPWPHTQRALQLQGLMSRVQGLQGNAAGGGQASGQKLLLGLTPECRSMRAQTSKGSPADIKSSVSRLQSGANCRTSVRRQAVSHTPTEDAKVAAP